MFCVDTSPGPLCACKCHVDDPTSVRGQLNAYDGEQEPHTAHTKSPPVHRALQHVTWTVTQRMQRLFLILIPLSSPHAHMLLLRAHMTTQLPTCRTVHSSCPAPSITSLPATQHINCYPKHAKLRINLNSSYDRNPSARRVRPLLRQRAGPPKCARADPYTAHTRPPAPHRFTQRVTWAVTPSMHCSTGTSYDPLIRPSAHGTCTRYHDSEQGHPTAHVPHPTELIPGPQRRIAPSHASHGPLPQANMAQ